MACAMVTRSASGVADDVLLLTKLTAVTEGRSKNSEKQKETRSYIVEQSPNRYRYNMYIT